MKANGASMLYLLAFASGDALASDMGNGRALLGVWIVGGVIVLVYSANKATKEETPSSPGEINYPDFFALLAKLLPVVFVMGILAAMT